MTVIENAISQEVFDNYPQILNVASLFHTFGDELESYKYLQLQKKI